MQTTTAGRPADPIAAVTHPDPYPWYAELTRQGGLIWHDGLKLWLAASAASVEAVLAHPSCRVRPAAQPTPPGLVGTPAGEVFRRLVRMNDGDVHARLRPSVERALASVSLAAARELAEQAARELPTEAVSGGAIDALLTALPVRVVGGLFGVRDERLSALAAGFARSVASGEAVDAGAAAADLLALFRAAPDAGPLAELRGSLDAEMASANVVGFLSQTYDATAGLIGNGLVALARRPALRAALLEEPGRMEPFLAETLRYDSPVQNTRRFLHADAEVAAARLPAGAAILVLVAAANRDPAANPAPDDFAIERAVRRSFTFGLGAHACPGEALARTIAGAALRRLMACELDWESVAATSRYRPSANARVPVFAPAATG